MPQPLKRWYPMEFRNDVVTQHPELGASLARVSAAWSEAETELGFLLAMILDTEAKTGVHMYLALTGSAAQDKVLAAAAEARLSENLLTRFTELICTVRKRAAERNRVVHAVWGFCPQFPDSLINCPPDHMVRDVANQYAFYAITDFKVISEAGEPSPEFVSQLMRYTVKDFTDIVDRIEALKKELWEFATLVGDEHIERRALADELAGRSQKREDASPPDGDQNGPSE